jgi:hypothetical protein
MKPAPVLIVGDSSVSGSKFQGKGGPALRDRRWSLDFRPPKRRSILAQADGLGQEAYWATVLKNQDSPAVKIGGASEQVHIFIRHSKNSAWAERVEEIKTSSSRWVKTPERAWASFNGAAEVDFMSLDTRQQIG